MGSLTLTQNVLTLRDEIKGMITGVQLKGAMFIFTSHLGGVLLHNRLSRSDASGVITTANGISTRSGFRDKKKWIFSSTVFTIQALLFCWLYQKPSKPGRNVSCTQAERGGKLMLSHQR